jgi:hypothetical protein
MNFTVATALFAPLAARRKRLRASLVIGMILLSWVLDSCTIFSSSTKLPENSRISGVFYYLPYGKVRITGDFKLPQESTTAKQTLTTDVTAAPGTPPPPTAAQSPAPQSQGNSSTFTIVMAADIEPDTTTQYYLRRKANYLFDDKIDIGINPKHLLSTGKSTAVDETAQIVATTASIAANAIAPAIGYPTTLFHGIGFDGGGATKTDQEQLQAILSSFSQTTKVTTDLAKKLFSAINDKNGYVIDGKLQPGKPNPDFFDAFPAEIPLFSVVAFLSLYNQLNVKIISPLNNGKDQAVLDALSALMSSIVMPIYNPAKPIPFSIDFDPDCGTKDVNALLKPCGFKVTVNPILGIEVPCVKDTNSTVSSDATMAYSPVPEEGAGVVFRGLRGYRVKLESLTTIAGILRVSQEQVILLPDRHRPPFFLDYSRMAFITKTTNVTFLDGMPQEYSQSVPSPVLGFLAIPKGILEAVVPFLGRKSPNPTQGVGKPAASGTGK